MGLHHPLNSLFGRATYVGEYRAEIDGPARHLIIQPFARHRERASWHPRPMIDGFQGFVYDETTTTHSSAEEMQGYLQSNRLLHIHWSGTPAPSTLIGSLRGWHSFVFEGLRVAEPALHKSGLQQRATYTDRLWGGTASKGDPFWAEIQPAIYRGSLAVKPETVRALERILGKHHPSILEERLVEAR